MPFTKLQLSPLPSSLCLLDICVLKHKQYSSFYPDTDVSKENEVSLGFSSQHNCDYR